MRARHGQSKAMSSSVCFATACSEPQVGTCLPGTGTFPTICMEEGRKGCVHGVGSGSGEYGPHRAESFVHPRLAKQTFTQSPCNL